MTTAELRVGDYVEFDDGPRVIRRVISHPAGRAFEWVGGGAATAKQIAARAGRLIPAPLRAPGTTVAVTD